MRRTKGKRAWLILWEDVGNTWVNDDNRLAAMISGRRSRTFVLDVAKLLYRQRYSNAGDLVAILNKPFSEVQGAYPGDVIVGDHPFLIGRSVEQLESASDPSGQYEMLTWVEPAIYGNALDGGGITVRREARERFLKRLAKPLMTF